MPHKYVKRAVVVSAVQWTGYNVDEVKHFVANNRAFFYDTGALMPNRYRLAIITVENIEATANISDYIVRDAQGCFFPCRPDLFESAHERIE